MSSAVEMAVEDELSKYDNFDMDRYVLRKEIEVSSGLRGDTSSRAPISSSWLSWRVRLPNFLAVLTIALLVIYEIIVLISMFVVSVRKVMVEGGLMYALSGLNLLLIALLVIVVVVTRNDWNIGMLTSKLGRARTSSTTDDDD
jgi:hypothetical protein